MLIVDRDIIGGFWVNNMHAKAEENGLVHTLGGVERISKAECLHLCNLSSSP